MSPPKANPDRRVERTQRALLDALFDLIIERGYELLTVQNIIDRAGIGRATFYAHFDGKDTLLTHSVGRLRAGLREAARNAADRRLGFTLAFFQHLASHRRIYLSLVARESEVTAPRMVREMLLVLVREHLAGRQGDGQPPMPTELVARHVVASLWATTVWWLASDAPLPPEDINAQFRQLVLQGVAELL